MDTAPSDPGLIVYIARRLAKIVEVMLQWKQQFSDVATDPTLSRLLEMTRNVCDDAVEKISAIPDAIDSELEKYFAARTEGQSHILNLQWKLNSPITEEFEQEVQRITDLVARRF